CGACDAGESCDADGLCQPQGGHACDTASAITQLGTYTGSTGAADSTDVGTCGGDGPEAVWDFTAPADGCVFVSTEGSEYDTVLYVRSECADIDAELGCNDDAAGSQSEVQLQVEAGTTYSIFIDGFDAYAYGGIVLTLSDCGAVELCDDGADNDGDGLADCADLDCAEFPACATGDCCAAHATPGCDDAVISDCVCAQDPYCCDTEWDASCVGEVDSLACGTCGGAAEVCDDGADNDGDGLADCADPDCAGDPTCPDFCPGYTGADTCCQNSDPCGWAADNYCDCDSTCAWDVDDCGGTAEICDDDTDNDGDGLADCADPDCTFDPACTSAEICDDGQDNDGDGLADCADPDCAGDPACPDFCPGYTGADTCCQNADPCGYAGDGYCDCDSTCAWDVDDCGGGPDYCPGYAGTDECCQNGDPCGWAADGYCDCDSTCAWDAGDCGGGQDYCPGYTGTDECCQNGDPCGWAADGYCDCDSTCAWDAGDCGGAAEVCDDGADNDGDGLADCADPDC
ncbi:MAG TPA: hypothetical protein P5147_28385, partial [Myxococcota bacterium]|nr:hypothetical protein [Myxococcota bacterium]